jgi:hypothetical protein
MPTADPRSAARHSGIGGIVFFLGQPPLLVLDQLEQPGLDLLHVGDLVEDQLAVLPRGLHHEPAGAHQAVDGPLRE